MLGESVSAWKTQGLTHRLPSWHCFCLTQRERSCCSSKELFAGASHHQMQMIIQFCRQARPCLNWPTGWQRMRIDFRSSPKPATICGVSRQHIIGSSESRLCHPAADLTLTRETGSGSLNSRLLLGANGCLVSCLEEECGCHVRHKCPSSQKSRPSVLFSC